MFSEDVPGLCHEARIPCPHRGPCLSRATLTTANGANVAPPPLSVRLAEAPGTQAPPREDAGRVLWCRGEAATGGARILYQSAGSSPACSASDPVSCQCILRDIR